MYYIKCFPTCQSFLQKNRSVFCPYPKRQKRGAASPLLFEETRSPLRHNAPRCQRLAFLAETGALGFFTGTRIGTAAGTYRNMLGLTFTVAIKGTFMRLAGYLGGFFRFVETHVVVERKIPLFKRAAAGLILF